MIVGLYIMCVSVWEGERDGGEEGVKGRPLCFASRSAGSQ